MPSADLVPFDVPDPDRTTPPEGRYTESELQAIRAISGLAAVIYPIFWWLHRTGEVAYLDPLPLRLLVSASCAGVFVLSYRPAFVEQFLHRFALGLVYLITLHFFVLLALNRLEWELVFGVLLVLTGMNAGASLAFRTVRSLHVYLLTVLVGTAVTIVVVEDPVAPVPYFGAGMILASLISFFGIGAQLKGRETLLESRHRLRTVLTGAPIVFWSVDREGRITTVEGKGLEALGVEPSEILGRTLPELLGDSGRLDGAVGGALAGEAGSATVEKDGVFLETWHAPLPDLEGTIVGTVGVATDVTDLYRANRKLREVQKMEAVGQLAGGIAHDFNNILTTVIGYTQLASSEAGEGSLMAESLTEIRTAGERAAALVRKLLAFSRHQKLEERTVDLNELVRSTLSMLERLAGDDLVLVTDLGEDVPPIEVDPTGIEQILTNLVLNARDASPRGGTVTIATRGETVRASGTTAPGTLADGRYVVLEFSDDGAGMDPEIVERIFEPFFTTKPFGEGSGLGLATVYGIVERIGGIVEVESDASSGTTFTIWLPARIDAPADAIGSERSEPDPP